MIMAKKLFVVVLILILAFTAIGCSDSGTTNSSDSADSEESLEPITIRMALGGSLEHPSYYAALQGKEYIERESEGKITVDLYPNSQLGGEREIVEQVKNGTLECGYTTVGPLTSHVKEFMVLDIPFLFNSYEEAWMVLDSNVGVSLAKELNKYDLELLCWMESGFRHITSNVPIKSPSDLEGIKMRTMEAEMHMANFNTLGANSTPVPWTELYLALSQGLVDAQENPVVNVFDIKLYEVQDYLTLDGHLYDAAPIVCNYDWYHGLPLSYQKTIKEGFAMMSNYNRFISYIMEDEYINALQSDFDMTVITLTDEEKAEFRDISQPAVATLVKEQLGDEFVENFLSGIDAIRAQEEVKID